MNKIEEASERLRFRRECRVLAAQELAKGSSDFLAQGDRATAEDCLQVAALYHARNAMPPEMR